MKPFVRVIAAALSVGIPWPAAAQIEVQTATLSARYKIVENESGVVTANHLQDSAAFKARAGLVPGKRLAITTGAATGASFTSGWNNTGAGTGHAKQQLFLKQLYLSAVPLSGVELQAGGLYLVRGESTEITSYDSDGYVAGGRLTIRRRAAALFDEIAITAGNIGNTGTPSVFPRLAHLDHMDYRQALVARKLGARVRVSADYTRHGDMSTVRQAVTVRGARPLLDTLTFEQYRRLGQRPAYGFAAHADRAIGHGVAVGGGYAAIDHDYGGLNGDKYFSGSRLFGSTVIALGPVVTTTVYLTRALQQEAPASNGTRLDVMLSYNVLESVQRRRK